MLVFDGDAIMSEAKESSPRMRWFQFDLRLLFVVITAVGVILALEMARRSGAARGKGLVSAVKVGDQVILAQHDQGFEITLQKGAYSHTVTEIGADYVRLKHLDGVVSLIPLGKIYRIVEDPRPYGTGSFAAGGMGGMPAAGPGGMGAPGGFGGGASSVGSSGSGPPGAYGPTIPGASVGPGASGGVGTSGGGAPSAVQPGSGGDGSTAPQGAIER
jgi:hypothetical protein